METDHLSPEERVRLARRSVEILHAWPTDTGARMIVLKAAARFLLEQDADGAAIYRWRTALMLYSRPVLRRSTISEALEALAENVVEAAVGRAAD